MDDKKITPLNFIYYYWPVVGLCIAGLLDSIYLSFSHYKIYTDIAYQSFCAVTKAFNCDTVSSSRFAIFAGVPVAVWGVYAYSLLIGMVSIGFFEQNKRRPLWGIIFIICIIFSLSSIFLALISNYYIHSYCIMCIFSYLVNFAAGFYVYIIIKRFHGNYFIQVLVQDFKFILKKISKHMVYMHCYWDRHLSFGIFSQLLAF